MPPLEFTPDDFKDVDWTKLDAAIVSEQIQLLNTLSEEDLKALTGRVNDYVDAAERKQAILGWVQTILGFGLRLMAL